MQTYQPSKEQHQQASQQPEREGEQLEHGVSLSPPQLVLGASGLPSNPSSSQSGKLNSFSPLQRAVIQRYGSQEHSDLGDKGSGQQTYNIPKSGNAKLDFTITHGDLVMLSGDYFDPRDKLPDGSPNPDSLFMMINRPSSDPGKQLCTQDEVIYAIWKIKPNDKRFQANGIWHSLNGDDKYSDEVKKAHDDRYLKLASQNIEHFVAPSGKELSPQAGMRKSAGGSYRALHEAAILMGYKAGQNNQSVDPALMREGAAQHFLTDYFAAGHVRTPRLSIRKYWGAKYPLFWGNLQKKIALDVARHINSHDRIGNIATVTQIFDDIIKQIQDKTKDMPALGFDDLVSMVAHDLDNEKGLMVENDRGDRWKTLGDSNLHRSPETQKYAQQAVHLGMEDIRLAHSLGASANASFVDADILNKVMTQGTALQNGKYAPEQMVPHLARTGNGDQNWKSDSFETLWNIKVRDDVDKTYGQLISESVKTGEIAEKMEGMAKKFPVSQDVKAVFTVHPRSAFENGFFHKLKTNPFKGLQSIIHYNPSEGQASFNTDDAVMDEAATMTDKDMKGFTLIQRRDRIKNLISGWTADDEQKMIVKLFRTAKPADRKKLYKMIEGHEWNGDFRHGWLTSDDDLWNDLSSDLLKELKKLINAS